MAQKSDEVRNKNREHIYVFGGMGNESGEQSVGRNYLHDLYLLDRKQQSVRRLWQNASDHRLVVARDMILTPDEKYIYALCYPEYLSDTYLQLYRLTVDDGTMKAPDFVNAPPKLRFVARYVEKWFHCEVLLRQEECLSEVSPVFRHPYPDCRDSFGCLKHLIDTHPNLVNGNESLQFLIYLIGDEANADMCLYPTFCKMKHRTHFQSSF